MLILSASFWYAKSFAIKKPNYAFSHPYSFIDSLKTPLKDSLKKQTEEAKKMTSPKGDSIPKDTLLKKPKGALEDIVKYKAKDSIIFNRVKNEIVLYNQTQVQYTDIDITAGIEVIKYGIGEVYAGRLKDSLGEYSQHPVFKQGGDVIEPDSIRFNYKTQRAIIRNAYTKQDENNVKGEIIKKENDSTYFMRNAIITTAEDLDDPDYYILVRKAKFVPKKKIVAGLSNMYIADVPTPIAIPFAYYPMVSGRTSGLIFPTFGEINNRGYFIQRGGYYFVINDHIDLALTADYFTNGSYGFEAQSAYNKRYKFTGNFNFAYENAVYSIKGLPDYSGTSMYRINWTHSKDAKSNPNSSFSASVNLSSNSSYYRESLNQINSPNVLNNTMQSSISYSKRFPAYPSVNLAVTASHSQNSNTRGIEMTLPALRTSVERIYPFVKQGATKKGLFENINLQYSMQADNRFSTVDSLFFSKKMFDEAKNGVRHSIPVSTSTKLFRYVNLGLSSSINETWQFKTIRRRNFNNNIGRAGIDTINGFDRYMTYNLGANLGTTIYGTFRFKKDSKIQAIRHVMRPSVSYSYSPSFEQYYDKYIADALGNVREYTRFENGIYGAPGGSESQNISYSLSNTFEAKIRQKDSTQTEAKKVMLLNTLNFSGGYNLRTKELSEVGMNVGTTLLEGKLPLTLSARLDPYGIDENGRRVKKFNISNGGSLFRLTGANFSTSYSFSNKNKGNDNKKNDNRASGGRADDLFGTSKSINESAYQKQNENQENQENQEKTTYYQASVPWDINIAYSLTYSNVARESRISNNSIMISGNVQLSPKLQVGISSGYDFVNKGITYTQLRFERDLGSFRMSFQMTPIGYYNSWNFFIGIKAPMLSDLKYDKSKEPDRALR